MEPVHMDDKTRLQLQNMINMQNNFSTERDIYFSDKITKSKLS